MAKFSKLKSWYLIILIEFRAQNLWVALSFPALSPHYGWLKENNRKLGFDVSLDIYNIS